MSDAPPARIAQLLEALRALGGSADEAALLGWLRSGPLPGLRPVPLARVVELAVQSGWVRRDGPLVVLAASAPALVADPIAIAELGAAQLRAVAVDLETLVRTTGEAPYLERAIREIGAVRFGPDTNWIAALPVMRLEVEVPERFDARRPAQATVPLGDALDALAEVCEGAHIVVTYNGTALDWPVLADAHETCGRPMPEYSHADLLPLVHALWPLAPDHRLATICALAGVPDEDWHHADADARATAALAGAAATELASREVGLRDLLLAVTRRSPAWRLVAELGGLGGGTSLEVDTVAAVLEAAIERPAVRGEPPPALGAFRPPLEWTGADGRVDAHALAVAVRPGAERRRGQDLMQEAVRLAAARGLDVAVEAPTGTGKSLVVLAEALDWLAGDPERIAVVATHTKQLQAQLARDLERLVAVHPGLAAIATVAKGSGNRLSLRALTVGLAEASRANRRPRGRTAHGAYGELLAFLTLRFAATPGGLLEDWEIRSVDTADVPPFFDEASRGRWRSWLADLSQANAADLAADEPLGVHTRSAAEHLDSARLVIANHALVFAHLDHLLLAGDRTLVLADEAHTLEAAATEALTARLETPALEAAASRARGAAVTLGEPFTLIADGLEELLDNQILHGTAMDAVDALAGRGDPGGGGYPRAAALASAYTGGRGRGAVRSVVAELGRLARRLEGSRKMVGGFLAREGAGLPPADRAQAADLLARLSALAEAVATVVADTDRIWGTDHLSPRPPRSPARRTAVAPPMTSGDRLEAAAGLPVAVSGVELGDASGSSNGVRASSGGEDSAGSASSADGSAGEVDDGATDDDGPVLGLDLDGEDNGGVTGDDAQLADEADLDEEGGGDTGRTGEGEGVTSGPTVPAGSNRVVILAELPGSDLSAGRRGYRFVVSSSPVRLPADARWQDFTNGFARLVLTSATLTVQGDWGFVEHRLGVTPPRWDRVVVPGPFDWSSQARLFVLEDFPSWVEQPEGAVRTAAHQLAGYGAEAAICSAPAGLVLTTSTSAASAIADRLATELGEHDAPVTVWSAPIHGNRRALELHQADGGILIGTKGLWAGVDIDDPARVRMVWINKLPFPSFADPLIATRRAEAAARAEVAGHPDPETVASETYYLPLAALELRQGVGRLIRSPHHHGVVVVSDRRLAGTSAMRRTWRRILLGSLDAGLNRPDPITGEAWAGNVMPMTEAWAGIFAHLAACGHFDPSRVEELCKPERLEAHVWCPETLAVRAAAMNDAEAATLRAAGRYVAEVTGRAETVARNLRYAPALSLDKVQRDAVAAAAAGADVLALLPTGSGKSFCFQLPALIEPGVTVVVSPLVALMADQALELNRVAGGAVRALVAPMRESVSRAGRQDLADQLEGRADHGIKLVYLSPERLAQRTVRQWLAAGVAAGRVRRLVFDEAHTLVQWGDDFRPSYRRLAAHLGELHAVHPAGRLPVSAFTATANRSVHAGLHRLLFDGLPAAGAADPAPGTLVTLAGDPIRPELAIYRRQLRATGAVGVARLVESLIETITDHTIVYATTVRQVEATWAHLRAYVGDADAARIRRFHGRLPEAEKADVLNAFRQAPTREEAAASGEPFAPLIVVASSAFGLGVDRRDVRCVISLTPPTDLAALYQQLGRAGRDARGTVPVDLADANVGIALATAQGFRTVEWLTRDVAARVLDGAGRAVLRCGSVLDAERVADDLLAADVAGGYLQPEQASVGFTVEAYRSAVTRALASLVDAGCVEDLGDFPSLARLRPAEGTAVDDLDTALAARAAAGGEAVDVAALHAELAGIAEVAEDPAGLWAQIVDAHHRGVVDASCASGRWRTAVRCEATRLPADWSDRIAQRAQRARDEIAELRAWYADTDRCANAGFADYFSLAGPGTMPAACCSTAANRCSTCQARHAGDAPPLHEALLHPRAARSGPTVDEGRLDRAVAVLLGDAYQGLGLPLLRKVLRGEDTYYDIRAGRRRPLRSRLLRHRLFGAFPGLRDDAITASIARLAAAGLAGQDPATGRWRHQRALAADAARATAAAGGTS